MPTNAEIMHQITALERRMDGYEKRMESYETQATDNTKLLKEVKAATDFIKRSFRFLRWSAMLVASAALWQVGTSLFHAITGH